VTSQPDPEAPRAQANPSGVRVIIVYKLTKAVLMLAGVVALWAGIHDGIATWLAHVSLDLTEHAVHPLLARFTRWLSLAFAPDRVLLLELLLVGDAILSAVEGWVLHKGYAWGRWLVVIASGSLLPFEIFEICRKPHLGRILAFVINAAIVVYLLRRVRSRRE
jgi:uncharacterized membrane protein (DUF2068 family)